LGFDNKVNYIENIFSSILVQAILKYRSIEYDIKEEIKEMMSKYEYFE